MNKKTDNELLKDESLGQKIFKKGFWLYFFAYLGAPCGSIVRLLISNSPDISVADVGSLYSIIGLIGFIDIYNDLGLTESLKYFLPKFWIHKKYNNIKTAIYISFFIQVSTAILIASGLRFGSDWLATHYFHHPIAGQILKYFCFYFLGLNIIQTLQTIFISFQDTFRCQVVEFVKLRTTALFVIFCFFSGRGTIGRFSTSWIIGLVIATILAIILFNSKYKEPLFQGKFEWDTPMLKTYLKYALITFTAANIGNISGQVIQQTTIFFIGSEGAGYFTNFMSLFGIAGILLTPISGLIFPIITELSTKNETKEMTKLISLFYGYFSVLMLSMAALYILLGQEIAVLLFGKEYITSGILLCYSGLFLVFSSLSGFNFAVIGGLGKVKERVKILRWLAISTIITTLLCVGGLGIFGSILSFGLNTIFSRWLTFRLIKQYVNLSLINRKIIRKNIITIILLCGIVFYLKGRINGLEGDRFIALTKLTIVGISFYLCLGLTNINEIKILRKNLRKN